jgi:chromosome segregation ATPase
MVITDQLAKLSIRRRELPLMIDARALRLEWLQMQSEEPQIAELAALEQRLRDEHQLSHKKIAEARQENEEIFSRLRGVSEDLGGRRRKLTGRKSRIAALEARLRGEAAVAPAAPHGTMFV